MGRSAWGRACLKALLRIRGVIVTGLGVTSLEIRGILGGQMKRAGLVAVFGLVKDLFTSLRVTVAHVRCGTARRGG